MNAVDWPLWSVAADPAAVARYIVPAEVRRYAQIPEPSDDAPLRRRRTLWDRLRALGVGYAHEREATVAGQWIRAPAEVLVVPRNGTCLDLALVLAAACEHAGLEAAVVVLDSVVPGQAGHVVVTVRLTVDWPGGSPPDGGWQAMPAEWPTSLRSGTAGSRVHNLIALDPNGLARSLGTSRTAGTATDLDEAAAAGRRYLTDGRWVWRIGVTARLADRSYRPAPMPAVAPLRPIYREPEQGEPPMRLLRAEYRMTPFHGRGELTILLDLCERTTGGERIGLAVIHGVGGAGKINFGCRRSGGPQPAHRLPRRPQRGLTGSDS